MKNIKFLIVVVLSIKFLCISSYTHATTKQDNEPLTEPQKTVRIVVEQSYRNKTNPVPGPGISLPFESTAQRLLAYANLIVVAPETKDSDYTLTIRAIGQALGAQYSVFAGSQYYYTGASLRGTAILLGCAGTSLHSISFSGEIFPPNKINLSRASIYPSDAPFIGAFMNLRW
jgi:hypothetical protein